MEHQQKRNKVLSPEQKAALIAAGESKREERAKKKLQGEQNKEITSLRKKAEAERKEALIEKKKNLAWAIFYLNSCSYTGNKPEKSEVEKIKNLLSVTDYHVHRDDYCKIVPLGMDFEGEKIKEVCCQFLREQLENNIFEPFTIISTLSGGYISAKVCEILLDFKDMFAAHEIGKHIFIKLDETIKEDGQFDVKRRKFVPLKKEKKERLIKVIKAYLPIYLKRFTDSGYELREEFQDALIRYSNLASKELKEKISARLHELENDGKGVPKGLIALYE